MVEQIVREDMEKLIQAPSACAEIAVAGKRYLEAVGTADGAATREVLAGKLRENVCSIDNLVAFMSSSDGKAVFGEETAAATKTTMEAAKANGEPNYLYDVCQTRAHILREVGGA